MDISSFMLSPLVKDPAAYMLVATKINLLFKALIIVLLWRLRVSASIGYGKCCGLSLVYLLSAFAYLVALPVHEVMPLWQWVSLMWLGDLVATAVFIRLLYTPNDEFINMKDDFR